MKRLICLVFTLIPGMALAGGCGSDDEGGGAPDPDASSAGNGGAGGSSMGTGGVMIPDARSPEQTGSSCDAPTDCFPNVSDDLLSGEVECLTQVQDGYCTHECTADADCCAAAGECRTGLTQVCSPFTSTSAEYCFLSCEEEDIRAAGGDLADGGVMDGNAYCQREAHPDFVCRSSGGGSANRKVCLPAGGGDAGLQPERDGGGGGTGGEPGSPEAGAVEGGSTPEGGITPDGSADATTDATLDARPD